MTEKYARAVAALERFALCEANLQLACYWLSLWKDDAPPARSEFNPAGARNLLPGMTIFEINSFGDIVCRLAGTAVDSALGFSLANKSLMKFVPVNEQHTRQRRLGALVEGAVAVARSTYRDPSGVLRTMENLNLPFGGESETGARQFLIHTNIRPTIHEKLRRPAGWHAGYPDEYHLQRFV
jgi:hypothetical protein